MTTAAGPARPPSPLGVLEDTSLDALLDVLAERVADRLAEHLAEQEPPSAAWMTSDEAAAYLRCDAKRVSELQREGKLRCGRDGRKLLFRRADLDAYLERRS